MRNSLSLAYKDVTSCFHSWLGILIFTFFYLIIGIFFSLFVLSYARISAEVAQNAYQGVEALKMTQFIFGSFFLNLAVALIFFIPLISMRSFTEERRFQTLELLFTYPLSDIDIVGGKFLGLISFLTLLMVPTAGYLFLFRLLEGNLEWGPILLAYFGFLFLGAAFLSLGLFISSLTDNQVVSAIVTFGILVFLWALDWGAGISDGWLAHFLAALSPLAHYRPFALGVFDLSDAVYFSFFILYFLFLTLRSIETRNWRG
jgi:ABC-2 type transport system permease protein